MKNKILLSIIVICFGFISCLKTNGDSNQTNSKGGMMNYEVNKSDEDWKKELTPEQYRILRQKGTEMAFTGALYKNQDKGSYVCAACGAVLFSSDTKYESGSGWPSFYQPVKDGAVDKQKDSSHGMERTEILCSKCGGHLGHVFNDGPRPTGLRYCINSASLKFQKE
ncbi:peptide methionine sulfoxide reductase [Leptospira interrogans serovar Manilae]|nr:peptide methionine sulfoxide reductase [Leptospira interrogans serovar Manilae]AKP28881.1 peptide methionine sulfoxide reductase [Leptospira interrogans serovar Manilae]EYU64587.1 peptide methionine sulfoxide reductase [Leptospira interrogans serovar Manilae]